MVTTDIIIQAMNSTAKESQSDEPEEVEEVGRQQPAEDVPIREEIAEVTLETPAGNLEESQPSEEVAAEEDGVEEEKDEKDVAEAVGPTVMTRSGRNIVHPSRYMQVTKVSREDWKTEASSIAINAEIKMLFQDLKALRCVQRAEIKAGMKILKSHMFVVEKYLANGKFDKRKARLVADGRDQDAAMYSRQIFPNCSYTFSVHCAGISEW
jgi:hypothetical protein